LHGPHAVVGDVVVARSRTERTNERTGTTERIDGRRTRRVDDDDDTNDDDDTPPNRTGTTGTGPGREPEKPNGSGTGKFGFLPVTVGPG